MAASRYPAGQGRTVMRVASVMRQKLVEGLAPARLEIVDESRRHAGHTGSREGGESHFRIEVVSAAFANMSRVTRHRLVYDLLKAELEAGVHALSLATLTPEEDAAHGAALTVRRTA